GGEAGWGVDDGGRGSRTGKRVGLVGAGAVTGRGRGWWHGRYDGRGVVAGYGRKVRARGWWHSRCVGVGTGAATGGGDESVSLADREAHRGPSVVWWRPGGRV
nr:hypothetical protein [Tanacetum cinerariifolium]